MFDESDKSFSGILSALELFVARLDPAEYSSVDVPVVLKRLTRAEKLCATAKLLMARRASELFAGDSEGTTSTARWLAGQSGESVGKARRDLDTAGRLASQPELEEALRHGVVSPTQASVLLPALEADPDASQRLIGAAQGDSLNELRQECQRVVAARRSEEEATERDARLRERRHLHIGTTEDGAVSIQGELPPVEGAVVKNALEAVKRMIFDEARKAGRRESHEAYMADALVALCRDEGRSTTATRSPRAEIVLHVSAEALRRGELQAGECCEIEGVGPVPLATVEYLFGNAWAKLIIEKGVEIASIAHFGRWIPAHLETALSKRDRVCAVPGCGISYGLERDHIIPVAEGGTTELANLVKLCRRHHYLKTHHFWRLTGQPGNWKWVNIRPGQRIVADGDLYDVARPGEPLAGLAHPLLRPRDPVFSDEGSDDHCPRQKVVQQSFACSFMAPIVVVRVSSTVLSPVAPRADCTPTGPRQPSPARRPALPTRRSRVDQRPRARACGQNPPKLARGPVTNRSRRPSAAPLLAPCDGTPPPHRRGRSSRTRTGRGRGGRRGRGRSVSGSLVTAGRRHTSSA